MQVKKVKNRKTGRQGWRYRFTVPGTGRRAKRTYWTTEQRDADRLYAKLMDGLVARAQNLPNDDGWRVTYATLVRRFQRTTEL